MCVVLEIEARALCMLGSVLPGGYFPKPFSSYFETIPHYVSQSGLKTTAQAMFSLSSCLSFYNARTTGIVGHIVQLESRTYSVPGVLRKRTSQQGEGHLTRLWGAAGSLGC